MNNFLSYIYFHVPNFILAALMYTLIGRMVLSAFVPENWDNYIMRFFVRVTDPVVNVVRVITPQILTKPAVMTFGVLWLLALRFAFVLILFKLGLAPKAA